MMRRAREIARQFIGDSATESNLRRLEVLLLLVTVYITFKSLVLQKEVAEITRNSLDLQRTSSTLANRPYISIDTNESMTLQRVSPAEYEWILPIKNTSSFPAVRIIRYGLVRVKKKYMFGISCRPYFPLLESKMEFERLNACSTDSPGFKIPDQSNTLGVCVNQDVGESALAPSGSAEFRFRIPAEYIDKIINEGQSPTSGLFFGIYYQSITGERFFSQVGLFPYLDKVETPSRLRIKLFSAGFT